MPETRLIRAAEVTAAEADRISAAFARQLAAVLKATERRLRALIREVEQGSRTAIVQAAQADRIRRQVRGVLRESGFDVLVEGSTGGALDRMADRVLTQRRLAQQSAALVGPATVRLQAFKDFHLDDLLEEGAQVTHQLRQAVTRTVLGSRTPRRALSELERVVDRSAARVGTLYDTSISIYGREVEMVLATSGPETPFAYFGPVDDRTRSFCLQRVGKVYTRQQIDRMDNGQLGNVFLSGGGYNCRHTWTEVSQASALAETGEAPEVRQDVRDIERRQAA